MTLKVMGIVLVLLALAAFYVAFDQYQQNAANVREMNKNPLMHSLVGGEITPAMPDTGKYAIAIGAAMLAGSLVCLVAGLRKSKSSD